jgi:two-component system sensor histidine kinase YesM
MTDFFPFLYREEDSVQEDYVFYQNEPVTDSESGITGLAPPLAERVLKAAGEESSGSISFREGRRQYLFVWHGIPNSDLLLVRDCSAEMIQESIIVIRIAAVIGILASIIILFLIIRFATQKMMGRLFVIMNGMREVRQGNLDINITVEGNDEISDMARMFINMVSRIRELIEGITREQQLVTQTEIKAMQNQINAHFLYNVLETIKMQAEVHNQDTIVQSITLLGKMLRYCLKLRLHRVALREELEYIRSYIALLNIRNDYTITVNEQIEDRYLDFEIPKMLIQPLVENAFLHAIEPLGENAIIDITVDADSARGIVWIGVYDHGQGLLPEALEKISASIFAEEAADRGIGLRNIQQRLTAFYGTSWKLRISSEYGKGTNILIPIPLE